jgi:DNA-binding protein HU-beta
MKIRMCGRLFRTNATCDPTRICRLRRPVHHRHLPAWSNELYLSIEGLFVNKTELVEHIAKHADISKAAATRALDSTITAIRTTLKKGGTVSLVGFGSFAVTKRPARKGRNPRTGAEIKIKAAKVPKFRPGKALKDALN